MHITYRAIPAAAIIVAATALSACGDDANAETLTAAEFHDQANALCAAQGLAIRGVIGPLFGNGEPTPEDMQTALDEIVALSRGLAHDIDALAAPNSIGPDVHELVTALEAGTDAAAAQTGIEFFGADDDPWADATSTAHNLGLDACGPEG